MTSKSAQDRKQPHALKLRAWPPEVIGEGLGILGVVVLAAIFLVLFKPDIGTLLEKARGSRVTAPQRYAP